MLPEGQQFFRRSPRRSFDQGRAQSRAEAVLSVLEARNLLVSAEQRKQVLASTDVDELDRWVRKAVTVASTEELFKD